METTRTSWTTKAENAIRSLRDIEGVNIQVEGDEIREVHVLTTSSRPAKQIVRDIETLLLTRFGRGIDRRVVSVVNVEPERTNGAGREVPGPQAAPAPARRTAPAQEGRIRFASVNLFVSGRRVQAQVEVRWKGVPRMGSASGWCTRDGAHALIAQATLAAVQDYLAEDVALGIDGLEVVHVGRREVVVVTLALLAHRQEKTLVGCCTVEQDAQQAVVLATLSALNRVLGGLRTKEPIEYVLRPASTQET